MCNYLRIQLISILNYQFYSRKELQQDILQFNKNILIKNSFYKTIKYLLRKDPAFSVVYHMRIKSYNRYFGKITKIIFPPKVDCLLCIDKIGPGFVIHHGNASVLCAKEIGENCVVCQQVTIGKGKTMHNRNIPVIGNNVTICSGAIIIGGVTIGDNVTIGAGAVINKDIPSNCTAVGNPFRII